jgi:methyl-accepting chemotaxis protein
VVEISLGGEKYMATAARLPRAAASTGKKPFPEGYPAPLAGAVVLMSVSKASGAVGATKTMILLLGAGALIIALLGMTLTSKRILTQADQIEAGVNEIINGNLDRTFQKVGSDLDGLANSLNVMLARVLGRPEPGDEEYDEYGNVVQPSAMHFDTEDLSAADAEVVQLAQEPEPDYYNRIFNEYISAREAVGESNDGVTYESFVAKLRLNEGNLKAKYQSRAVRFKVVTKDGKVSLKPVPIV